MRNAHFQLHKAQNIPWVQEERNSTSILKGGPERRELTVQGAESRLSEAGNLPSETKLL